MYQVSNVYVVCGFSALGGVLFGFDISSMSAVLGTQTYRQFFGLPDTRVQGAITACMPAGSLVGALSSSFLADRFSRRTALQVACALWITGSALQAGSISVSMLCTGRVISGIGVGIVSSVVPVYQSEIAPREIRGRMVSMYQWAITWGILIQYFVQYGCAKGIGNGPSDPNQSTMAFRIPWIIQIIPAFVLVVGLFFFPHSPRWLASKDRWDEAMMVLARLHGSGDRRHPRVLAQYREIEDALRVEHGAEALQRRAHMDAQHDTAQANPSATGFNATTTTTTTATATFDDDEQANEPPTAPRRRNTLSSMRRNSGSRDSARNWWVHSWDGFVWRFKMLATRKVIGRVILGMSVQAWSQLCGMNIMMYYIVYIMESAQIATPLLSASIQYIINVALTLPAILYLDRWGRRPSLIVGSFIMMVLMLTSGALQQRYGRPIEPQAPSDTGLESNGTSSIFTPAPMPMMNGSSVSWVIDRKTHRGASMAIVACSYLFVATFATTWGPTSWTYPAEIFPGGLRTMAVSLSTATNWLCNMALAFAVPPLHHNQLTNEQNSTTVNGIAFVHMYLTAYETKGYSLEEMEDVFNSGRPAWSSQKVPSRLTALEQAYEERSQQQHPHMHHHRRSALSSIFASTTQSIVWGGKKERGYSSTAHHLEEPEMPSMTDRGSLV